MRDSELRGDLRESRGRWAAIGVALTFALFGPFAAWCDEPRDLLIVNAKIFEHPAADTLVVLEGQIAAIGRRAEVTADLPPNIKTLDAQQGWVTPGFHDAHIHMLSGGKGLLELDLTTARTMPATLDAIAKYHAARGGNDWLEGRGWQYDIVPPKSFPTRQDLDRIVANRPVFLTSYDGHTAWLNTRALQLAEIDADTPDPRNGQIVREADGRTPSGILTEAAIELVERRRPAPTPAMIRRRLEAAIDHCLALGITSVTDLTDPFVVKYYAELLAEGRLPLRVSVSLPLQGDLEHYAKLRAAHSSPFLRIGFLKDFADGVVESKTAFLVDPYAGTTTRGRPFLGRQRQRDLIEAARRQDFVVGFHAVGDGAVRWTLDGFEQAAGDGPMRGRVEHIEVLHPVDAERFRRGRVVASMMPFHANPPQPDPDANAWSSNLTAEQRRHSFPWRELLDAGAILAFGSDWPVMTADPLQGIAVATTRRGPQGLPADGWNAHQRITPEEAIRAYTWGSAVADGVERHRGKLAPGLAADLVVLEPAVDFARPATLWSGPRIRWVVVDGRGRSEWKGVRRE